MTNLAIVFGPSNSIKSVKKNLVAALSKLTVSTEEVLPAIVTYGKEVKTLFEIGDLPNLQIATKEIQNLQESQPGNTITEALKSSKSLLTSRRPSATKTIWLVLSSNIANPDALKNKIKEMQGDGYQVLIFATKDIDNKITDIIKDGNIDIVKITDDINKLDTDKVIDSIETGI